MKTLLSIKENWEELKSQLKLKLEYVFSDDFLFVEGGEEELSGCPQKLAMTKKEPNRSGAEFQLKTFMAKVKC